MINFDSRVERRNETKYFDTKKGFIKYKNFKGKIDNETIKEKEDK